ncbi:MAG: T9SS type A sorting domain-containing protein [Calditrichaeota bacterium]|nr:T9SS type A sorting domain-containing protein [Calditrichota bacterium]
MRLWKFLILMLMVSNGLSQQITPDRLEELIEASKKLPDIKKNNFTLYKKVFSKISMPDSADYDQLYYDLDFRISMDPQNLEGTVTGLFRSNVNGLDRINLNFDSREDYPPYWSDMWVSGNINSYTHSNWVLAVVLDTVYDAGETFTVTVNYSGIPRPEGLAGFWFGNGVYTLSEPYAAQTWWPCKDDPSDKMDSVKIAVTVPTGYTVASNGLLQGQIPNPNNTTTFIWKEKYPITTYLVSLAIANYTTFSDSFQFAPGEFMPIEYYVYPYQLTAARSAFEKLPDMLEVFSRLYGLYPFIEEKYGHALFGWGGGMEHQTCTSIGTVSDSWETIYAHELAHQWFGDLVTCRDWHHIWLNEGFATYSEALWIEAYYDKSSFRTYVNSTLEPYNFSTIFRSAVYRYDTSNPNNLFSRTIYTKGMWVLHMLRYVVGDSVFFEIMHDYPNDPSFAYDDATTEEFRDFCEMKSEMDLDWFFQQWIYEPYYPVYDWGYTHYQQNGQDYLHFWIAQKQKLDGYSHLYKMPIEVRVIDTHINRDTLMIWDSLEVQDFHIPISGSPLVVQFDPDLRILKMSREVPIATLEPGNEVIRDFTLAQNYPNPFNGTTMIPFTIDTSGKVKLEIFDITGSRIRTLIDGYFTRGEEIRWDGCDDHDKQVSSGIYIYQIHFENRKLSRKMLLVR